MNRGDSGNINSDRRAIVVNAGVIADVYISERVLTVSRLKIERRRAPIPVGSREVGVRVVTGAAIEIRPETVTVEFRVSHFIAE